jgi:hypothetical protein
MIALVLELCGGALLAFSTITFLALAWASKSRPESKREANGRQIPTRHVEVDRSDLRSHDRPQGHRQAYAGVKATLRAYMQT